MYMELLILYRNLYRPDRKRFAYLLHVPASRAGVTGGKTFHIFK